MELSGPPHSRRLYCSCVQRIVLAVGCLAFCLPATAQSLSDLRESLRVTQDLQDDLRVLREDVRAARMPASTASAIPALQGAIDRVRADLLLTSSGSARLQEALQTSGLPVVAIQRQQQATAAFTERSDRLLAALDAVIAAANAPIDAARLRPALDALSALLDQESIE